MKSIRIVHFTFILLILVVYSNSYSQQKESGIKNPPINTEALFSNRGMTFQMIIDKHFISTPKFGFFGVTNLVGAWNNNHVGDHMTQANITYEVVKGFKVGGGFHLTPVTGIRPTATLIFIKANKNWFFVANARTDLSKDINFEGLVLVEYKPKINEKWRFYSRVQSLYSLNTPTNMHARSYIMARAGISCKEFTFGTGTNIDYYGPMRYNENSVGGFISYLLF